ncbi:hypothetical protein B0H16DRAFT_1783361 [Mycena metata]|uniref:Uncharacterized protein n=1 Tax=Mycena metata TaxID=1033252 RepID=A0AAD7KF16_9AGAR|nr:hypothetical protein B0H16DRAFT_1783361 [Mycena metata]
MLYTLEESGRWGGGGQRMSDFGFSPLNAFEFRSTCHSGSQNDFFDERAHGLRLTRLYVLAISTTVILNQRFPEVEQSDHDIVCVGKAVYLDFEGLFNNLRQTITSDSKPLPSIEDLIIVYPSLEGLYDAYPELFAAVARAVYAYHHCLCLREGIDPGPAFRVCRTEDARVYESIKSVEECWKEIPRRLASEVQRRIKSLAPTLPCGNWVESVVLPWLTVAAAQRRVLQSLRASMPRLVQVAGENIANLSDLYADLTCHLYEAAQDRPGPLPTFPLLQSVISRFLDYQSKIADGTGRPWVSARRWEMKQSYTCILYSNMVDFAYCTCISM